MLQEEERQRYSRQLILGEIGVTGQQQLKQASVLVIGAGGLGCPVLQYLAAAGVGSIGIADDDHVTLSNLHRQVLYNTRDIGQPKVQVAIAKLQVLNPHVQFQAHAVRLTAANAPTIIRDYDIVVDGSDNFTTRYLVNDVCVMLNKPLVFGSILGFEGQVSVFNYQDGPTYRCLYPEPSETATCEENGVLGTLPGIVGTYMANEVIKIITEAGQVLSGKLMVLDLLNNTQRLFRFFKTKRAVAEPLPAVQENMEGTDLLPLADYPALAAQYPGLYYLIDVREPYEFEEQNIGGINIPLHQLPAQLPQLPKDKIILCYCSHGKRSRIAMQLLRAYAAKEGHAMRVMLLSH